MATLFHPTTPRPWLAASALVAAVAGGLCAFWLGKAPASYLPVNLGSLSLAVIAMLAETMIPEAFEKAPPFIGLITVIGFLAAYLLAQH